jgi:hypothetical protein
MPKEYKYKYKLDIEKDKLSLLPVEFNNNNNVLKKELPEYLNGAPLDLGSIVAYNIKNFGILDKVL